jgi:hypothetical protein
VSSTISDRGIPPDAEIIEIGDTTAEPPEQANNSASFAVPTAMRLQKVEDFTPSPAAFVDLTFSDDEDEESRPGDRHFIATTDGVTFTDPKYASHRQNVDLSRFGADRNYEILSRSPTTSEARSVSEDSPSSSTTEQIESCSSSGDQDMVAVDSESIVTTESPDESLDSNLFSVSDSSEEMEPLDSNEPTHLVLNTLLRSLLLGFRSTVQYQLSPNENGEGSVPPSSATGSSTLGETSGPSRKRNRRATDDDDGGGDDADQDGFLRPPRKKISPGKEKTPQKSLACPYLKLDPLKHRSCCVKQLSRIRDVKQHLSRRHTPDRYCQRCLETNFADEQSLDRHVNLNTCLHRDRSLLEAVSHEQERQLSKKSNPNLEEKDQWFAIWDILFPGVSRPTSAYMDTCLSVEMRLFREYCSIHGPAALREQIETDPVWSGSEITEEQRRVYLDRVIAQGIDRLFEGYLRSNPSSNSFGDPRSSTSRRRSNMQPTPTSTGSVADSGVALESQVSSREATSQESLLEQTPGVMETVHQPEMADDHVQVDLTSEGGVVEPPQSYGEPLLDSSLMDMPYDFSYEGMYTYPLPTFGADQSFDGR